MKRGKTCQTEQPHRPQSDLIGAAFDRTLSPLHAPAYLRAAYRRRLYRMQDSNRLSWAIAILALMRNRPARRLAYYAAVAALARVALLRLTSSLNGLLSETIVRAARRLAAWQYARKYLVHLKMHSIDFDELPVPSSPVRTSSIGSLTKLPSISETDDSEHEEDDESSPSPVRRRRPPVPAPAEWAARV